MWVIALLFLAAATGVGPGLLIVRRLPLSPAERLLTAIGLSMLLVYLGGFLVFTLGLDPLWQCAVSAAGLAATVATAGDIARLFRSRAVRRMCGWFGVVLLVSLLLTGVIRSYAGGTWSGDWLEHYQRTRFFFGGIDPQFRFIDLYLLPARPPLMNVVATVYLAQAGFEYQVFQLVFLFLNALAFLPCCLIAGQFRLPSAARLRRLPAAVALLFIANPMAMQNVAYTWTKLFTAFYVILALHLYLRGWRKQSQAHMVLAFVMVTTGCLTHYSAAPYAVFMALHYGLGVRWGRRKRWREAGQIAIFSLCIVLSWVGWSVHAYGVRATFASNSSVSRVGTSVAPVEAVATTPTSATLDAVPTTAPASLPPAPSIWAAFRENLFRTIVPPLIVHPSLIRDDALAQFSAAGTVRDFTFILYQVSLPFAFGSVGMGAAGYLLWRWLIRPIATRPTPGDQRHALAERRFWVRMVPFVVLLGIFVYTAPDPYGVAHLCLQAIVLLGLALIAAGLPDLPRGLRWALVAGLAADFALGVLLHFGLESRTFDMIKLEQGAFSHWTPEVSADGFSRSAQYNWGAKVDANLVFLADNAAGARWALLSIVVALTVFVGWSALRPTRAVIARSRASHRPSRHDEDGKIRNTKSEGMARKKRKN